MMRQLVLVPVVLATLAVIALGDEQSANLERQIAETTYDLALYEMGAAADRLDENGIENPFTNATYQVGATTLGQAAEQLALGHLKMQTGEWAKAELHFVLSTIYSQGAIALFVTIFP